MTVWDSLQVQTYSLPLDTIPIAVRFDPENWILKDARKVPVTEVAEQDQAIHSFQLWQNYPNPFNPATVIRYAVPQAGWVELAVYNTRGEKVYTFPAAYRAAGNYEVTWQGKDEAGREAASGVYVYRLKMGETSIAGKMILLR
jgi:hypothetical protein